MIRKKTCLYLIGQTTFGSHYACSGRWQFKLSKSINHKWNNTETLLTYTASYKKAFCQNESSFDTDKKHVTICTWELGQYWKILKNIFNNTLKVHIGTKLPSRITYLLLLVPESARNFTIMRSFLINWFLYPFIWIRTVVKELILKLSLLVQLCTCNTPRIGNGPLWQTEFLGWQTALFSFLVLLSALIEIFCHGLEADAKQDCWPLCMCLSLSTFILADRSGDVKKKSEVERKRDK